MHHIRKRENGTENYWKCGTTKKKDGRCPVKGGIRDDKLRIACADALGLDEFDETAFLEQVDHIEVPKRYQIEIHMKDGRIIIADSADRSWSGSWQRIKLGKPDDLVRAMFPCSSDREPPYYRGRSSGGGYILIGDAGTEMPE